MDQTQIDSSKKRSLTQLHAQDLATKIKSKVDILTYLDKHCKSPLLPFLTPMQCSSISRLLRRSTKTS